MNANELADALDKATEYLRMIGDADFKEAADMLRQQQTKLEKSQELLREYTALNMRQQAEIEALKAQILMWENAEVPTEVMADIVEELERRGFITK